MSEDNYSNYCHECEIFKVSTTNVIMDFDLKSEIITEKYVFVKNMSDEPQALHINTPVTRYFTTEFSIPNGYVLPGKYIRITVKLHPHLELRPYCDRLKVYCKKGCGKVIKISASPRKEVVLKIPPEINLGCIPLGEKTTAKITIPQFQKTVPFVVISNSLNPDLSISPMKGVVKDHPVTIEITYIPKAYITVCFPIHIYLPSLTSSPYFLTVTADTKPGLLGQLISCNDEDVNKKKEVKKITKKVKVPLMLPKPINLEQNWSQHQTNRFLLEKEKCIKGQKVDDLGRPWSYHEEFKTKQQERFMNSVEEIKKLIQMGSYQKKDLFIDRSSDNVYDYSEFWDNIKKNKMEYNETIFHSFYAQKFSGRYLKYKAIDVQLSLSGKLKNPWFVKYTYLTKFMDAVRTVCIQNRMIKRLAILKNLTIEDITRIEEHVILFDD